MDPDLDGRIRSAMVDGTRVFFFVAEEDDVIQRHHSRGEFYEREEMTIIKRTFRPGSVFVDIGANVGNHTIYVGRFLHPREIIVFEPNPQAVAILRRNLDLNGLLDIVDTSHLGLGLSDGPGRATSWAPRGNLGAAKLSDDAAHGEITLTDGDSRLSGKRVDYVKIDAEGMELKVLAGLAQTVARCRPTLFVEVDDANAAGFARWMDENDYSIRMTFRRYLLNENYLVGPLERNPRGFVQRLVRRLRRRFTRRTPPTAAAA